MTTKSVPHRVTFIYLRIFILLYFRKVLSLFIFYLLVCYAFIFGTLVRFIPVFHISFTDIMTNQYGFGRIMNDLLFWNIDVKRSIFSKASFPERIDRLVSVLSRVCGK